MADTWNCYQPRAVPDALTIRSMSASIATTTAERAEHLIENRTAFDLQLTEDDVCLTARSCRPSVGARLAGFVGCPRLPAKAAPVRKHRQDVMAVVSLSGYAELWTRERVEKAFYRACHYRLHVGYAAGWLVRFRRYRDRDAFGWRRWLRTVLRLATSDDGRPWDWLARCCACEWRASPHAIRLGSVGPRLCR